MLRIGFFEDRHAVDLVPLTLTRPAFELLCGRHSVRQRLLTFLPVSEWGAFLRPHIVETYREAHPGIPVNDLTWLGDAPTLLVNGRWLPDLESLTSLEPETVGVVDDGIAYLLLDPGEAPLLTLDDWNDDLERLARTRRMIRANGRLVRYPWELVDLNASQLEADFGLHELPASQSNFGPGIEVLGRNDRVHVHPTAKIDPFVVLDAREGPVSIDAGAWIQSFTRLEGPCHVGPDSQLFSANIRGGTTIGPCCRAGGEIEASILHAFVNKYHYGFLGHSYVCPWVNLGAGTVNSDLKNDYSPVRVPLAGGLVDTGATKVGCFIGDHTKTALNSLFNTGSSVGVMCMVLPGSELLPKHIPSFSRFWHGQLGTRPDVQQSLQTARTVMQRRQQAFTAAQERLMRYLFESTRHERESAIARFSEKHRIRQAQLADPSTGATS